MTIIKHRPDLAITNLDALPRGTGARYLECIAPHKPGLPLIAVAWRRKPPARYAILIDLGA